MKWYFNLGIKKENLKTREVPKSELAHYAKRAIDIEYKFPFGWKEIEGIHNRGDWDLSNHSKHSGKDLSILDEKSGERFVPRIIETSAGADRGALTFLVDAYTEISGGRTTTTEAIKEVEIMLKLDKKLAPVKIAIFPLSKKEEPAKIAREIYQNLKTEFICEYDETQSIGKRYRRQDEIGTSYCITVDFETLQENAVTVRDRATMKQERVKIDELKKYLDEKLNRR